MSFIGGIMILTCQDYLLFKLKVCIPGVWWSQESQEIPGDQTGGGAWRTGVVPWLGQQKAG